MMICECVPVRNMGCPNTEADFVHEGVWRGANNSRANLRAAKRQKDRRRETLRDAVRIRVRVAELCKVTRDIICSPSQDPCCSRIQKQTVCMMGIRRCHREPYQAQAEIALLSPRRREGRSGAKEDQGQRGHRRA